MFQEGEATEGPTAGLRSRDAHSSKGQKKGEFFWNSILILCTRGKGFKLYLVWFLFFFPPEQVHLFRCAYRLLNIQIKKCCGTFFQKLLITIGFWVYRNVTGYLVDVKVLVWSDRWCLILMYWTINLLC